MKRILTYGFLLFALLLSVSVTGKQSHDELHACPALPANNVSLNDGLPDHPLCNIHEIQSPSCPVYKREQGERDLLLLHAQKESEIVKASSGDHVKFADELTHYFLFLFPHHFFW